MRRFRFPNGCEDGHQAGQPAPRRGHRSELGRPASSAARQNQERVVQELKPLTLLGLEGEELGGLGRGFPGRWIWKPESHPVATLRIRGKAISQERVPPGEGGDGSCVRL